MVSGFFGLVRVSGSVLWGTSARESQRKYNYFAEM